MDSATTILQFTHDTTQPVECINIPTGFVQGDSMAHEIRIVLRSNGKPLSVYGYDVNSTVLRTGDDVTITPFAGTLTNGVASIVIPRACYNHAGRINIVVRLLKGDEAITIFWATAMVAKSHSNNYIDPEEVIPSIDELMALISTMESTATRAERAIAALENIEADVASKVTSPEDGTVGHVLAVKSVNAHGRPTEWQTVPRGDVQTDKTLSLPNVPADAAAVGSVLGSCAVVNRSVTTDTISPNVFNVWGTVESLNLSFASGQAGRANEYMGQFTAASDAFALNVPASVHWVSAPTYKSGVTYQFSILNDIGVIVGA